MSQCLKEKDPWGAILCAVPCSVQCRWWRTQVLSGSLEIVCSQGRLQNKLISLATLVARHLLAY